MTSGIDGELAGPWAGADRPTADPGLPLAGADELKTGASSGPDESPTGDDAAEDGPAGNGPGGDGIDIDGVDSDGDGAELPPTIYDVARAAGVSIASVSRVLNGTRNPSCRPGRACSRPRTRTSSSRT
jgi:hypothetical protein